MGKFPVGQGKGRAGRFAGLPDKYSSLEHSKIVILPIPFDKTTTYQHGTDKGPASIIEASRNVELYDIETDSDVYLHGICTLDPLKCHSSEEMISMAYQSVIDLLKQNKFVVTLGGEHSVSYAPIKACGDFLSGISVLHIDAHADLQNTYEGNPWSHACVMARVQELYCISHIVSVGIRSMSREELKNLRPQYTFFAHTLFESFSWIHDVLTRLTDQVYITIDLDAFDSSIMPSTGTPEPGGLNWMQMTALLKLVAQHKRIVGFDVVELCPNPKNAAPDFVAAKLVYKLLSYIYKYKA